MVTSVDHKCIHFGRIVDEAIIDDRKIAPKKLNITQSPTRQTHTVEINAGSRYLKEIKWTG